MKWYYQSGMEDDTLLVLKNYDSVDGVAKCMLFTRAYKRHFQLELLYLAYLGISGWILPLLIMDLLQMSHTAPFHFPLLV